MIKLAVLLLILSILFATTRNLLSKKISDLKFGEKNFFLSQSLIFLSGCVILTLVSKTPFSAISSETVFYAGIYCCLLLAAQYCYTIALKNGNVGICSIVYSLGFIFPTLSGAIFWNETLSVYNIIGIILVIPTIIISGIKPETQKNNVHNNNYIFPLIIAMLGSGGLGILQKIQQLSAYSNQKDVFLATSFAFAAFFSFILYLFKLNATSDTNFKRKIIPAIGIGFVFGAANFLNTTLAGMLDSAVFFPILNIGTILFSVVSGMIFYKEKISSKDIAVLILGILSIILITLF